MKKHYEREYTSNGGMCAALAAAEEITRLTARRRLESIASYIHPGRWLDIGCSTGVFVEEATRAGFDTTGLELSEYAVKEARSRGLRVYQGSAEEVSSCGTYDAVTAFDLLEHLLDPPAFLSAARKLLAPGGLLALTTPDSGSFFERLMGRRWYFYIPERHLHCFDRGNVALLLKRHGFRIVKIKRATKTLTYQYSLLQFKAYNPTIYKLLRAPARLLPTKLLELPLSLYIGEMLVIAKRSD